MVWILWLMIYLENHASDVTAWAIFSFANPNLSWTTLEINAKPPPSRHRTTVYGMLNCSWLIVNLVKAPTKSTKKTAKMMSGWTCSLETSWLLVNSVAHHSYLRNPKRHLSLKIISRICQNASNMISKWPQNDHEIIPKWFQGNLNPWNMYRYRTAISF